MKNVKKIVSLACATLLTVGLLTGCGDANTKNSTSGEGEETKTAQSLVVWSHLQQNEVEELDKVAQEWAAKTGNKVKVVRDESDFQSFLQAANSSSGPDIMYGIAHDNLGTFHKAGLLAKVPEGSINKEDYIDTAVKGCTYSDGMFAVPITIETYGLFYNKDKVETVPKTQDELISMGQKVGFNYDINNFYYTYAFIAGKGGYVFKEDSNGALDPNDIGLGNEGAVEGYTLIQDMVQKYKLMPQDLNGDKAKGAFQAGNVGLYIGGPWDIQSFKDANLNFGVAPLPDMPSFVGVQAGFVSSNSKHQELAWDLMKYLQENNDEVLKVGSRIPALKSTLEKDEYKNNEIVQAFVEQVKNGTPMPNIPEMSTVWGPGENNITLLIQGKQTPQDCAKNIVEQIKQGISALE